MGALPSNVGCLGASPRKYLRFQALKSAVWWILEILAMDNGESKKPHRSDKGRGVRTPRPSPWIRHCLACFIRDVISLYLSLRGCMGATSFPGSTPAFKMAAGGMGVLEREGSLVKGGVGLIRRWSYWRREWVT